MPHQSLPPVNCFVGMFDVIGFKALRALKGTAGLHQQYMRGILPAIEHSAAGQGRSRIVDGQSMYVPDFSRATLKYRAISDSVLFFAPDDSFASFVEIVNSAFSLLQFGFSGGKAPFRGAIGYGDLIDDGRGIMLGSAIEDAYSGESQQAWAGAMLTSASRDIATERGYIDQYVAVHLQASEKAVDERTKENAELNSRRLVRYAVPTQVNPKNGPVQYSHLDTFAIDWTIRMYNGASRASFNKTENEHAAAIAANTCRFEDWARAQ